MQNLSTLIYLPSLIGITLVALATFVNRRSKGAGNFAIFSFLIAAWLTPQYIAQQTDGSWHPLGLLRLTSYLSVFLGLSFLIFIYSFASRKPLSPRGRHSLVAISCAAVLISFFAGSIKEVSVSTNGIAVKEADYTYFVLVGLVVFYLIFGIYKLIESTIKASKSQKQQNIYLLLGVGQTIVLCGLATTVFAADQAAQMLIPVSLFIMVAFTAFTIAKHGLFNIRLIVARTLAYMAVIGTAAAIFSFGVFGISSLLFGGNTLPLSQQITYVFVALCLAFFLPVLKRYFDRTTNSIFYRDAYDAQIFLDELNKVLVSTYELTPLLRDSLRIISENIKPTYAFFALKETPTSDQKIVGTENSPNFSSQDMAIARSSTPKMGKKLILADTLDDKHHAFQQVLRKNDVAVLARLSPSVSQEGIGYLMLGPKMSGNMYSKQDLRIIEIIANELVIAIQNSMRVEEVANFNVTLQAKVNDATRKLQKTNDKLKALDETKDDFISMASHQLRTPLTSVKGYISMVLEEDAGKITPMQKEMLGQAFFSSQRMVYLIADLLNVSRLKTGKFVIEPSQVNLARVIEEELIQLKETAEARQLKLEFVKPKDFPDIPLDETKIRQVIMNFVDNAIYYTPAGGKIKVKLINEPRTIELRVEDNGLGVPKSEQPHLFTKFYRAANARKARPDGTGLGLFMAKKVIAAQGGSVLFESKEGKGSTFGFIFNKHHLNQLATEHKSQNTNTTSTNRAQK